MTFWPRKSWRLPAMWAMTKPVMIRPVTATRYLPPTEEPRCGLTQPLMDCPEGTLLVRFCFLLGALLDMACGSRSRVVVREAIFILGGARGGARGRGRSADFENLLCL